MSKIENILAVDIGADSLKLAEFSYLPDGAVILEKFAFAEYGGDLKDKELLDSLAEAFRSTLAVNNFSAKKVHLSVSSQSAFIRFVTLPPLSLEESVIRNMVELEARQNVPFDMDELIWDYQLIGGSEDDSEIEVVFVVLKKDFIEGITKIIESFGKDPVLVEVAPISCFNAARANAVGEDECVMVLNIGAHCSNLIFIDNGCFFERSIPIAGHSVTQRISKEFGIPYCDAEEMKRRHGFVALGGAYEEPDSEVAATVSKIVRNMMCKLHGEINRSINLYRSQQKGAKPSKLLLAGGASLMAFTPRFFSEKLRMPVEYFNPFQILSLSESVDRQELAELAHMFSEVIGLGLRGATVCPIEISLVPEVITKQHELKSKYSYFYVSMLVFLLSLGISLLGYWKQSVIDKNRFATADQMRAEINDIGLKVRSKHNDLRKLISKHDRVRRTLGNRLTMVGILNELQEAMPDRMWLTRIVPCDPPANIVNNNPQKSPNNAFRRIFNPNWRKNNPKPAKTDQFEWLELKGHSLLDKSNRRYIYDFTKNIQKSDMFENLDYSLDSFKLGEGANNVTSFSLKIKLKESI